jgi:hypothetical protein
LYFIFVTRGKRHSLNVNLKSDFIEFLKTLK